MNEIQTSILALLPPKRKTTPSGWTSFNAPCCRNRGEQYDTRQRGGVLLSPEGGFQYHCFNCNFKAGWQVGKLVSKNTKDLFKWLGMSATDISKLSLLALKLKDNQPISKKSLSFELIEKPLPEMTVSLTEWSNNNNTEEEELALLEIFNYLQTRGMEYDWYPWHWSYSPGYRDRIILPFYNNGKIVGHTGRKITSGKPKYLTDAQPGYVFNIDAQTSKREFVIVVEGQFDAIGIDGVAIMHNEPNTTQCARINALGKQVIVVPDRDKPGAKLLAAALENGWGASMPPWEDDVKDTADAVKKYGRLYTLTTILHYKITNEVKIQLLKKKLEALTNE
jgi:hypothetical protein